MLLADRLPDQERVPHEGDPGNPGHGLRRQLHATQALGVQLEAERPEVVGHLVAMAGDAAKPEFGVELHGAPVVARRIQQEPGSALEQEQRGHGRNRSQREVPEPAARRTRRIAGGLRMGLAPE